MIKISENIILSRANEDDRYLLIELDSEEQDPINVCVEIQVKDRELYIIDLYDYADTSNDVSGFYTDISFMIEDVQPEILKYI